MESETFGGPVRFKDPKTQQADGWRDIDLTLKANADGSVSPTAVPGSLVLSGGGSADEGLVAWVGASGRSLRLGSGLPGVELPKPVLDGSAATYPDVLPGVDLRVQVQRAGFEQLWVIKDRPGLDRFVAVRASGDRVSLDAPLTTEDMSPAPQSDGSVKFTDSKDRTVAALKSPTMWDATVDAKSGVPTSARRIEFGITAAGKELLPKDPAQAGEFALAVHADKAWLTDPARKFPITIDPTYEDGSSAVTFDTYVQAGDTTDRSSDGEIRLGVDGSGNVARSYLNVDTASLAGRKVMSGSLALWETWSADCTAKSWSAYNAGAASTSTRWTAQPTTGTKFATSSATKGFSGSCPAGEVSVDMTAQLQNWATGGGSTNGLMLRADSETDALAFKRFESGQSVHPPKLTWTANRAPVAMAVPTSTAAVSYTPSGSSTPFLYTADRRPNLSGIVSDPDGDLVTAGFQASTTTAFTSVASSCTSAAVASEASAGCELGIDLAADGRYYLRGRAQDNNTAYGAYSGPQEIRVAAVTPAVPVVSCPAPYSAGSWQTTVPAAPVTCTISAVGTGYSAPSRISLSLDGNPNYQSTPIPQSSSASVAKMTVTIPNTPGGHSIIANAVNPAGLFSSTTFYVGWGNTPLLKRPNAAQPRITTTDNVQVYIASKGQASPVPVAKVQWRISGATGTAGWKDAPAGTTMTVSQAVGGSQSLALGFFDTTTIVGVADASGLVLSGRAPTLIDVRGCITLSTGLQCSGQATILRVPHAFGSGYPVAEAGPGQVALWTGELQVDDADAELATPDGSLSVTRSHSSFSGAPAVQNKVFGPGWAASFDSDDSGAGGSELYDGTNLDGTLAVLDADGEALVFSTPTGARRTTTTIPTGTYKPADHDTQTAGMTLTVAGSGASTIAELKSDDGIITKFQVSAAPTTGSATFRTVEVRDPAMAGKTTYSYDASNRVTAITAPLPDGVSACVPGTKTNGCRVLRINYAADPLAPGEFLGQVKSITAQVNTDATDRVLATYKYDSSGRLVEATDTRVGLSTGYAWTGSGTTLRLAGLTPPGLAPYTFSYTSNKLAKVTRPNPATAGGGTAQLAAYVYAVPTSGTGLPNMPAVSESWAQAKTPTWGGAVFGPEQPITGITPAAVTDAEWWKRADLHYTDGDGYTVNTAGWGAGDWQYTAADYDGNGNIIRAFDERGTRAVLAGGIGPEAASRHATLTTTNADILNGSGQVITPAGTLETDTYSPVQQVVAADGSLQMLRTHTETSYDQGAPNSGLNPSTGQPYRLPTTVVTSAEFEDGTHNQTLSRAFSGYEPLATGDLSGWELGEATTSSTDMDSSGTVTAADITTGTRYDTKGRVIQNRQPKSDGTDAGTRVTTYYTGDTSAPVTACQSKPEYAGMVCRVGPAAQPAGQTMPVSTTTGYTWDGQTTTSTETSGAVTSTSTTSYDTEDRPVTATTTVAGLAGSTPVPAVTTSYDATTGAVTGTTSTAGSTAQAYDTWGRPLTYTNTPAGQPADTSTTTYNTVGQVTAVVDNNGETRYGYDGTDANGQPETRGLATSVVVKTTGGAEYTSTGAYDFAGDLVTEKLPGKIIRRTIIDTAGEAISHTYSGQGLDSSTGTLIQDKPWLGWSTAHNASDQIVREWTPGGIGYDGRLGTIASATDHSYKYDKGGRLTQVKDRLQNLNPATTQAPGCTTRTYTFDNNGNRTNQASINPAADGECVTTGGTTISRTYDTADRPTTGGNGTGTYIYDPLGRQTTIPAADAPNSAAGNITLGYYDTDAAKTITQNGATTSFTLDGAGRRLTQTRTGTNPNTLVRHYSDSGDNPTWSLDTTAGVQTTTRYNELIDGNLGLTLTTTGATTNAELDLATPRGDIATTITLPTGGTSPTGTAATGIDTWNDYTEYGQPQQAVTTTPGGPTGIGYGWLGTKQRATLDTGLTLMGARMFNQATGLFTSADPVDSGGDTAYGYPNDPVNQSDLDGNSWRSVKRFLWKYRWDIALTAASFIPGLGVIAWGVRAWRVARVIRAVNAGKEIRASRYITRVAAKRWVGRPRQVHRGTWVSKNRRGRTVVQRFRRYYNPNTGRGWRSPTYKNNRNYRGYYSNFTLGKRNVHIRHRRFW